VITLTLWCEMDKNIQKKIVDRIESLCAEKRIAKKELADRCDFSPTTFSRTMSTVLLFINLHITIPIFYQKILDVTFLIHFSFDTKSITLYLLYVGSI
jgi:hypothetical protein